MFKSQVTIYLVKESKHVSEYVWHGQVKELGEIFKTQSLALEFMNPVPIILQELLWVHTLQPEIKHLHTISTQMEEQTLSAPVIITGFSHSNRKRNRRILSQKWNLQYDVECDRIWTNKSKVGVVQ